MEEFMKKAKAQKEFEVRPFRLEGVSNNPTWAEMSIHHGRDDKHMIYEMFQISQYSDGSVLNCLTMKFFTAQEIVDMGKPNLRPSAGGTAEQRKLWQAVFGDLRRNAKAALKNGTTTNLAPVVG